MSKDIYFFHVASTQASFRVAGVRENTLSSRKIEEMHFAWQAWDKTSINSFCFPFFLPSFVHSCSFFHGLWHLSEMFLPLSPKKTNTPVESQWIWILCSRYSLAVLVSLLNSISVPPPGWSPFQLNVLQVFGLLDGNDACFYVPLKGLLSSSSSLDVPGRLQYM